jgi:molecular chaperone DnaK (HSP70)
VVSEPAAASAYYAYLHEKTAHEPFNERMLIVDYGGGTLDISLTKVSTVRREDGTTAMEIDLEGETGAGENHGDQIGDAGIAYMDGTVRLALAQAGFENVPCNGSFIKAVNLFESALINKAAELRDKIQLDCANDVSRLEYDDEVLTTLFYRGKKIPVTYGILYQSYQQIIQPVLAEQLQKVKTEYLDPLGVDPRQTADKLKLALVGGFGQFELVRQQVYDFFHVVRQLEDGGREDAICYGAALVAEGVVTLRKSAKLSMGLVSWFYGEKTFDFAITKRMELEYDKVYYMPNPIIFGGSYSAARQHTWEFAIGRGNDLMEAHSLVPLKRTQDELNKIEPEKTYTFGFSVDDSDIYSIHVIPTDPDGEICFEEAGRKIRLGNFSDIFGPNVSYSQTDLIRKQQ